MKKRKEKSMSRTFELAARIRLINSLKEILYAGNLKTHWDINANGENILHLLCRTLNEKVHVKSSMILAIVKMASAHHYFCWAPDYSGATPIYILLERGLLTSKLFNCLVRNVHDCGRMVNTSTGETLVSYAIRTRCFELVEYVHTRFKHGIFCARLTSPGSFCPYTLAAKHGFGVKDHDKFCCGSTLKRPYVYDRYMSLRQSEDSFEQAILDNRLLFLKNSKCLRSALEIRSIQYVTINIETSLCMFTSLTATAPFELTPNMAPSPILSIMFGEDEIVSGLRQQLTYRHWAIIVKQLEQVVRHVGEFVVFILDGYSQDNRHVEKLISRAPPLFRFIVENGTSMMPQFDMNDIGNKSTTTASCDRAQYLSDLEVAAAEQLLIQKRAVDIVLSPISGCSK